MNLNALWQNTWFRVAVVGVAALVVLAGVWAALASSNDAPSWLPAFPGVSGERSADSTGAVVPDGTADKGTATVTPAADGNTGGAPGDKPAADKGDTTDDDANGSKDPADDGTKPAAKTVSIMILFWNDTEQKAPKGLEVAVGDVVWKLADPTAESATGELKGLVVGKKYELEVYPDGRNGNRILVPFEFAADMRSGSEADAIHVEVRDEQVRVLGTPVDNFDVSVDRFK